MPGVSVVMPTIDDVEHPRNQGYLGRLDELLLRLAITPESMLEIEVVEAQAPRIQLGASFAAIPEATMVASVGDVSGGEGLFSTSKARSELDQRRFYASRGIDTSVASGGRPDGFTLLHQTELALSDPAAIAPYMVVMDQALFYAQGHLVAQMAAPLFGASITLEDPFVANASELTGLVKLGGELFASTLDLAGIAKRSLGGTWAELGANPNVYGLWSAKSQLFAAHDQSFESIDTDTGTPIVLLTLPPGAMVTAVADGGDAVLVADSTGSVRSFALDAASALVEFSATRVGISSTEVVTCMAAGFGVVLIGTKELTAAGGTLGRLYSAELSGSDASYRLVNIQLIREFPSLSAADERHPTTIAFRKTSAYVAVPGNGETVLWRYQLATRGLSEDLVFPVEASAYGLAVVQDRLLISLAGVGVWRESADYLVEGYLISSMSDFGFATEKNWAWLNFLGSGLGSGNTVEISIASNQAALEDPLHPDWRVILNLYDNAALGALAPIFDVEEREVAVMTKLRSGGGASTPRATAVSIYAYPVTDELRMRVPVNVSDRVERHGRRPLTVRGYGNHYYRELLSRRGQSAELELYRQGIVVRGVLENVQMATPGVGHRSSGMLVCFLTFKGRVLTLGGVGIVSPSTLGVGGILGIKYTLGV